MRVIGWNGSPRKAGNTAFAVNQIIGGAGAAGAETDFFYAGSLNIQPCQGCLSCVNGEGCVIKDDMQQIYVALKSADVLVFGTPIYMGQMSAQAKAFIDRLFAFITPRFSPRFKEENAGKKLILVWTQGNPDGEKFKVYLDYVKTMFAMLELDVRDVIVVTGTRTHPAEEQAGLAKMLFGIGTKLSEGEVLS